MENNIFEIIGKDTKTGIGRDGQQYVIENLVVNFAGKAAKIRIPRNMTANIGDSVRVGAWSCQELWLFTDWSCCSGSYFTGEERRL